MGKCIEKSTGKKREYIKYNGNNLDEVIEFVPLVFRDKEREYYKIDRYFIKNKSETLIQWNCTQSMFESLYEIINEAPINRMAYKTLYEYLKEENERLRAKLDKITEVVNGNV